MSQTHFDSLVLTLLGIEMLSGDNGAPLQVISSPRLSNSDEKDPSTGKPNPGNVANGRPGNKSDGKPNPGNATPDPNEDNNRQVDQIKSQQDKGSSSDGGAESKTPNDKLPSASEIQSDS
jgi:hypothetical protein